LISIATDYHDQVKAIAAIKLDVAINHRQSLLLLYLESDMSKFERQAGLVG
jgi:hypothetical protein